MRPLLSISIGILLVLGCWSPVISTEIDTESLNLSLLVDSSDPLSVSLSKLIQHHLELFGITLTLHDFPRAEYEYQLTSSDKIWNLSLTSFDNPDKRYFPDYAHQYLSSAKIGSDIYQLDSPDSSQYNAIGMDSSMVDNLLHNITTAGDMSVLMELLDDFNDIFMTALLYDYPLFQANDFLITRNGLEGIDPVLGIVKSILAGSKWNLPTSSKSTINLQYKYFSDNFDPLQMNNESLLFMEPLVSNLVLIDSYGDVHPSAARQWGVKSWNNSGSEIRNGIYTFELYDNIMYAQTKHAILPQDFGFSIDLMQLKNTHPMIGDIYGRIDHYRISNHTIEIFITDPRADDIYYLSKIPPTPTWLLDTVLTLDNPEYTIYFNPLDDLYSPFDSIEWNAFEGSPISSGAFNLQSLVRHSNNTIDMTFNLRDDYWYPNELDIENFGSHLANGTDPTFFIQSSGEKADDLQIRQLNIHLYQTDYIVTVEDFLESNFDLVLIDTNSDMGVHIPNTVNTTPFPSVSNSYRLVFNLQNTLLRDVRFRKAIAHLINKDAIEELLHPYLTPQDGFISPWFREFYNDHWVIPYDQFTAKEYLMELNINSNLLNTNSQVYPIETIVSTKYTERNLSIMASMMVIAIIPSAIGRKIRFF
ncbi:MAG: ABC transporter substrate-binding protein [Candidatus Kariarchaeaceae archaeon]|jgi:ABC-type transport system substrate-binding protein